MNCDHNTDKVIRELKRYGMTRETHRALTRSDEFDQDASAIAYARWLAKRDRKRIPAKCGATAIRVGDKICAVDFFTRPNCKGRRRIEIPNWNWLPAVEVIA